MTPPADRWTANRAHWDRTLDSDNLGDKASPLPLETRIALSQTADVRRALRHLEPLSGRCVIDIGGGPALAAIAFARRGAHVLICDVSVARLRVAQQIVREAGLEGRITCVAAAAEHLPFADRSADRLFTKSVLIHTRLDETVAECTRVLAPHGRAAFIEPLRRNPFVNLYRAIAAPKIWAHITTYFSEREMRTVRRAFAPWGVRVQPCFFLGFFASVFSFAIRSPLLYRWTEHFLGTLDKLLFAAFPSLRRRAWFAVMLAGGQRNARPASRSRR